MKTSAPPPQTPKERRAAAAQNQGFSLALAMGFSLIAMVIGLAFVGRAFKDNSLSANQKTTSRSMAAAEAGVTRYLALINRNRRIARHSNCRNEQANGTCNDNGTTPNDVSWFNNSSPNPSCPSSTNGGNNEVYNFSRALAWRDLDPLDSSKGQYRLVSYKYSGNANVGTGLLTIDGRVGQRGAKDSVSSPASTRGLGAAAEDFQTSNTRLQVEIPVSSVPPTTLPFPGVWVKNAESSNNKFQANVLISCSETDNVNVVGNDSNGQPYTLMRRSLPMPSVPPKPSPIPNSLGSANGVTLPRNTDIATTETINGVPTKVFRYSVPSISMSGQGALTINTTVPAATPLNSNLPQRVILYLDGDISLQGQAKIDHICKDTNGVVNNNCPMTNLQIYGYSTNGEICTGGNGNFSGFIFAPTYKVGMAGGGNSGGFKGAIWANQWSASGGCGSHANKVAVIQWGSWAEVAGLTGDIVPPQLSAVTNWKVMEMER